MKWYRDLFICFKVGCCGNSNQSTPDIQGQMKCVDPVQGMPDVQRHSKQGHSDCTVCTAQAYLTTTQILMSTFDKEPL